MAITNPQIIVWAGLNSTGTPTLFSGNGCVLVGSGSHQYGVSGDSSCTIGELRHQFSDPSIAPWLADECPAIYYSHPAFGDLVAVRVGHVLDYKAPLTCYPPGG